MLCSKFIIYVCKQKTVIRLLSVFFFFFFSEAAWIVLSLPTGASL